MLEIVCDQPYTVFNYDFGPHDLVSWRWHVPPDEVLQTEQEVARFRADSMALVEAVRSSVDIIHAEDRELIGALLHQIADSVEEHWRLGTLSYCLVPRQVAGTLIRVTKDGGLEVQVSRTEGVRIIWNPRIV